MKQHEYALILGGSSGMGKATAKRFLEKGYAVKLIGKNSDKLKEAQSSLLGKNGATVEVTTIDLYDVNAVKQFIENIKAETRHIKYLLNAAGFFKPVDFLKQTSNDYDAQMDLNKAFFFITQAVALNMKSHSGDSIVNIGSMWAHQAVKATPSSSYSMQKAGLHALTRNLAIELAPYKIRVNAVAPAVVVSPIYKAFIAEEKIEQELKIFDPFHPIGRIGNVEDIANAIEFLFSEKAAWITGEIINVDGGVMAGRM